MAKISPTPLMISWEPFEVTGTLRGTLTAVADMSKQLQFAKRALS